jgi:hypothetical protein
MCDCNSRCDMRPTRTIPVTGNATDSVLTVGGLGFSSPVMGNPRGEPYANLPPSSRVQALIEKPFVTPPYGQGAGGALSESEGGASTVTYALKEHWPWLVVGGLALAAVLWKSK